VTAGPARAGRARFDIGDIVRRHRAQLEAQHPLTSAQKRVLTDIAQCRTAALGGHVDHCPSCGYEHPSYNSCRNRHCPKCQALAQENWIEQRRERLLDVGHFHVVFTLPEQLRPLARCAPDVVFHALFRAAANTLLELGEDRLGVTLGATLVLHTWTRELSFHPHVHAIVTAGGLALDGQRFCRVRDEFLFPVEVMGKLLRGKVLHILSEAYAAGLFAHVHAFHDPAAFGRLIARVAKLSWNVYAKKPLDSSQHVVAYLGRYTHRVGIANSRLIDVTDERVVFRTRGNDTETLHPVEFLWRFVQHVLPDGFHKIRHIGLYASPKLAVARERLSMPPAPPRRRRSSYEQKLLELTGRDVRRCPVCLTPLLRLPVARSARDPPLPIAA
jgi:putative transposase/transposase-like zinc-binding protein